MNNVFSAKSGDICGALLLRRLCVAGNKLNNRPRKRFGFLTPNQVHLQIINNKGQVAFMT
jgi:hypothetical protein